MALRVIVQAKGVTPDGVKILVEELRRLGSGRIVVRSDGGNAILAHLDKACNWAIIVASGLLILKKVAPKGQSQANGLAEGAAKGAKVCFRSSRFCLEEVLGAEIPNGHLVLAWLVQLGCLCVNVGRRCADGKTAYELRCGCSWKRNLSIVCLSTIWFPTEKRIGTNAVGYGGHFPWRVDLCKL